jgi:putative redox protein
MSETKPPKPPNKVTVRWTGEQTFEATDIAGHTSRIDGNRGISASPVDTLLNALGSCSAVDVVEILAKRRTPVRELTVHVTGERAAATPARVTRVVLAFTIKGAGIERTHAERAIDLAVNKYCSVKDSLDPNMPVEWTLDLAE